MDTPGALGPVLDALIALENTIEPGNLQVIRWRPLALPDLPALYHWMPVSPSDRRATGMIRDTLTILSRIAIRHTDPDEEGTAIEHYFDTARDVYDNALVGGDTTLGISSRVTRVSAQTILDEFAGVSVLCLEFTFSVVLDRLIPHN